MEIKLFDKESNIQRKIKVFQYKDKDIYYVIGHKYFNGTQLAQSVNKEISRWIKRVDTSEDIYSFAKDLNLIKQVKYDDDTFLKLKDTEKAKYIRENNFWGLIKIKKGGAPNEALQGTFVSYKLILQLARWCSNDCLKQVEQWIKEINNQIELPAITNHEDNLSYRIHTWMILCMDTPNLFNEFIIKNDNILRRIDFISKNKNNVILYELKKRKITVNDIVEVIHNKQYLQLCRLHFGKPCKLIMLSPVGIEEKALSLLKETPNIQYKSVQQLCEEAFEYAVKHRWKDNVVDLKRRCLSDLFRPLFSQIFLSKVISYASKN